MYEISVETHFDAAHSLRGYGGKCEQLHGHRFKLVVTLNASRLNKTGLAYDFTDLKRDLEPITARLDHHCLNEVPPFDKINPSSENLARTVFEWLAPKFAKGNAKLASVEVWESPTSRAVYRP